MNEAIRQVTHVQNIRYDKAEERLYIIDQTLLPNEEKEIELRTVEEMIEAIKMLRIRGAPAIGICAGYCMYALARDIDAKDNETFYRKLRIDGELLGAARPTAVNLRWAVGEMLDTAKAHLKDDRAELLEALYRKAVDIHEDDIAKCTAISEYGLSLLKDGDGVLTHCNAIRPGGVLPNGQIVDGSTGLVETLEAVKPYYDEAVKNGDPVGLACAMKNAGVGVGIPDTGRVRLTVREGKLHIFAGASCIGQGLGTVLTQTVCGETGIPRENVVYERSNTWIAPDSGTTSGSRQTLFTGEACIRACQDLKKALEGKSLADLEGQEFYGEYLGKTDPLGADVPNPVSHIAYGYATQLCVLDKDTGRIKRMVAAHDVGKAVNPLSVEGQIEGGVVMSMGYALTERYPIDENCRPTVKFGTLGLFRANQIPEIKPIIVEKPGLNVGGGAIGIGEITSIPTAPAIAEAYRRYDGELRTELPLKNTPYAKK